MTQIKSQRGYFDLIKEAVENGNVPDLSTLQDNEDVTPESVIRDLIDKVIFK